MPEHPQSLRAADVVRLGHLSMSSEREGGVHTICLHGELDLANTDVVDRELERVEATDASAIVLDLAALTFMDSTGIRLLVCATARSRADSHRLTLLRGPAAVQRALDLCGITDRLPFAD